MAFKMHLPCWSLEFSELQDGGRATAIFANNQNGGGKLRHQEECEMSNGFKLFQRVAVFVLGVLLVTAMSVSNVHAQAATTFGTILGTITDTSGAVVTGAAVTVTNTNTNLASRFTTDDHGRYVAPSLIPGTYSVEIEKSGFQKVVHQGIILPVGANVVVDETLPVGKIEQVVEVQSQVSQVDTTTSTLSNLVAPTQMVGLPLNGRDYTQLLVLAPGVQQTQNVGMAEAGKGATYSVAGQRPEGAAYLLDGTDVNNYANHGPGSDVLGTSLGVDAIAEFQILTNSYSAQYGGNGVAINAETRSGTNQMHGSAFEFLRNSKLDTRNYFDRTATSAPGVFTPTPVPEYRRNQYGGTLGGPIKKDKMFYFVNYEGLAAAEGYTETIYVPDANAQEGLLACGSASTDAAGPCPPGNTTGTINVGVSSAVKPLLPLWPATTAVAANGSGIVSQTLVASDASHENYVLGRIDGTISSKDSIFGNFVLDRSNYSYPFAFTQIPTWPDYENNQNIYFTLEERHVTSNNLVNSIREYYTRNMVGVNITHYTPPLDVINAGQAAQNVDVIVTGLSYLGPNPAEALGENFQQKWGVGDDLIWTKGAHTLAAGVDVQRVSSVASIGYLEGGEFVYAGLESFLLNSAENFLGALPGHMNPYASESESRFSPYINDNWKVSRKLTVNAGLRYDLVTDPVCTSGYCTTVTNLQTSTAWSQVSHLFAGNPFTHNFEPRVGLAYDPFGDHKTSIRAGFGLFHDVMRPFNYLPGYSQSGVDFTLDYIPGFFLPNGGFPSSASAFTSYLAGQPTAAPSTTFGMPYIVNHNPYSMQWNLTVQRSLGWGTLLQVGYLGSRGVHLLIGQDANPEEEIDGSFETPVGAPPFPWFGNPRPNPALGSLDYAQTNGWSTYNALQVNLTRQFSHGLTLQANDTWQKCLDITDGINPVFNGALPTSNPWDSRADYGPCGYSQTEVFHANAVYELPFKGNRAVAGWQTSLIATATTGQPFSPWLGYDAANQNQAGDDPPYYPERPNLNSGYTCNNSLITGNPNGWFNTAAFSAPELGTLGDLGRNCLRGPGLLDLDYSLGKETKIGERLSALLRVEAFNIINHTNFVQQPGTVGSTDAPWNLLYTGPGVANPAVGVITSTQTSSRQIQASLKLQF
jgi:hypothetical protein